MRKKSMQKFIASSSNLKSQAEKALKAIDQYQKNKYKSSEKTLSLLYNTKGLQLNSQLFNTDISIKQFAPKEVIRVQLLPNSILNFKIRVKADLQPKIIIRNYRGTPSRMLIGYDKLPKQSYNTTINRVILSSELLIKLNKQKFKNSQWVYFVFKNEDNLVMFNFRMDEESLRHKKKKLKTEKSHNQSIEVIEEENSGLLVEANEQKSSRNRAKSLRLKSIPKEEFLKPEEKKRKLQIQRYLEQEKIAQAKVRKENSEALRVKEMESRQLGLKCKKLVEEYDQLITQQKKIAANLVQRASVMMILTKFCLVSNNLCSKRINDSEQKFMIQYFADKFRRKMIRALQNKKRMIEGSENRQKIEFVMNMTLEGVVINRYCRKKAQALAFQTVQNCLIGLLINQSMNQASQYRRHIRTIQKRWRTKYQARTKMLMMYAQEQLLIILKNFPHLKQVEPLFRKNNVALQLCRQYQKETADKVKQLFQAYQMKLIEIQEYKQINQEIREFNSTALKKRQKEQLEVPQAPARPQPRFFRDLLFLKSMIRGWLQVQLRKYKKLSLKKGTEIPIVQKRGSMKSLSKKKIK